MNQPENLLIHDTLFKFYDSDIETTTSADLLKALFEDIGAPVLREWARLTNAMAVVKSNTLVQEIMSDISRVSDLVNNGSMTYIAIIEDLCQRHIGK